MNNLNSSSGKGCDLVELFSDTSRIITTTVYAVTIICGLVGNGLGLFLASRRKAGNRATNLFIANMAVADLLVTLFAMPSSVLFINVGQKWIGGVIGQVTCKFVHFAYQMSIPASIFTVLLVSFHRYFVICHPMKANVFRNGKVMTAVIWISCAVYAIPFVMAYDIVEYNDASYCLRIFSPFDYQKSGQTYYLVTFILLYFVPLTILLVLYSLITHRLWQRKIPGNVNKARIRLVQREKRRIIKALILIVMVFVICWFPAHATHYLAYYRTDIYCNIPAEVVVFFFWLCHANSIINPCLYVLISPSYRKFVVRIFGRVCSCCSHANFNSFRINKQGTRCSDKPNSFWGKVP